MPKIVDREDMQRGILDAAMRAFGEKGYHAATIADVAAAAGLGKGTLYLYFRNKEAIAEAMVDRHFSGMEAAQRKQPRADTLAQFTTTLFDTMKVPDDHARFIRVFFEVFGPSFAAEGFRERIAAFFDRSGDHYAEALAHLQARGEVAPDIAVKPAGRALAAMVDGMMLHRGLFAISSPRYLEMRRQAVRVFVDGLRPA